MPIYEYRCQACGHQLETTQRMSEPPLVDCPACSKPQLERLISRSAFVLKGGGWYKDLYSTPKEGGSSRSEGDRADRLSKAITDDAKKSETTGGTSDNSSATADSNTSTSSSSAS